MSDKRLTNAYIVSTLSVVFMAILDRTAELIATIFIGILNYGYLGFGTTACSRNARDFIAALNGER